MKLSSDLKEFIELLNSQKVDYLVVGAHALAWHGLPPKVAQDAVSTFHQTAAVLQE